MQFTPSSGDCDFSYYRKSKSSRKHRRHFLDYNNNNNSICRKILPFFPFFFVIIPENCLGCNWDSTVFPLSFNIEKPSVSINWLLLASFGLIVFAFLILDVTAAGSASSMNYLDVVLRTFSTIQCIFVEKKKFLFFSLISHSSGWAVTSIDRNKNHPVHPELKCFDLEFRTFHNFEDVKFHPSRIRRSERRYVYWKEVELCVFK